MPCGFLLEALPELQATLCRRNWQGQMTSSHWWGEFGHPIKIALSAPLNKTWCSSNILHYLSINCIFKVSIYRLPLPHCLLSIFISISASLSLSPPPPPLCLYLLPSISSSFLSLSPSSILFIAFSPPPSSLPSSPPSSLPSPLLIECHYRNMGKLNH